jgi:ankyrin repeat protein
LSALSPPPPPSTHTHKHTSKHTHTHAHTQETPLKRAAYHGHVDVLSFLLETGADLNAADGQNKMVLNPKP